MESTESATTGRHGAAPVRATAIGAGSHGTATSDGTHSGGTHAPANSDGREPAAPHAGGAHSTGATAASPPGQWQWSGAWAIPWTIVSCESGGNYGALNPSSGAGGAYQILPSTWRDYGGTGEPQTAPPAEQDRIAAAIWADSGPAAWVCAQGGSSFASGVPPAFGPLPDPLPPAKRLDAQFFSLLLHTAHENGVGWPLLLADVRLHGGRGPSPASASDLSRVAARIAALRPAPLAKRARELFAARSGAARLVALAHFNRAVGRRGLILGLRAVKAELARRVLASKRLQIYEGGRADIAAGRVDVRVLTLLLYLAQSYRSVTVSCLISGHSFLTTAGRPSLHAFGRAVDISALDGTPIVGHQEPGGITERALRRILLLPRELQPSELISLFSLGGPSFAAADHADHIHVGF